MALGPTPIYREKNLAHKTHFMANASATGAVKVALLEDGLSY